MFRLTKRDAETVLRALSLAEAWENSLADCNRHIEGGESYREARKAEKHYRETALRLTKRYELLWPDSSEKKEGV